MQTTRWVAALCLAGAMGATPAQPASAEPPCLAASGEGTPDGRCGRAGPPGPRARGGRADTPGWRMMTPQERQAHHARMAGMTDYGECRVYAERHFQQMSERARQRRLRMPMHADRDACAPLKPAQPPASQPKPKK